MQFTPSELQAINHAYYELSALQVQVQLLRLELLAKANFDPDQPRVPRGNRDGGQWTRGGSAAARTGTDTTGVREPPPRSGIETTVLPGSTRGEVIQVASWTSAGPEIEYLRPDLGFGQPSADGMIVGSAALLGLALALHAWLASTATTPHQTPVLALRAREFGKPQSTVGIELSYVGRLEYEDARAACPGIVDVQGWTNDAATKAGPTTRYASPSAYGTAVHTRLKDIVRDQSDDDLKAKISYLKSTEQGYGVPGTIRIDVLDRRRDKALPGTVCVYDIKTGASSLGKARSAEIVRNVLRAFPGTLRFVVIEVRPGQ